MLKNETYLLAMGQYYQHRTKWRVFHCDARSLVAQWPQLRSGMVQGEQELFITGLTGVCLEEKHGG